MASPSDLRIRLRPVPLSAALARSEVDRALPDAVDQETRETALLLLTELVANAVLHVGAPLEVDLRAASAGALRIEVKDPSPFPPKPREPHESTSGRGLKLVDALADRWGVDVTNRGKTVWFELDL